MTYDQRLAVFRAFFESNGGNFEALLKEYWDVVQAYLMGAGIDYVHEKMGAGDIGLEVDNFEQMLQYLDTQCFPEKYQ